MKVEEVAGHMKRGDLAFAIEHKIISSSKAAHEQCAVIGRTALEHHVLAGGELPEAGSGLLKRCLLSG
jgi:hypothetical protein